MNALNARTQTLPYKYFLTLSQQILEIDEFTTYEQLAGQIDQDKGATDGVPGDGEFEEDKEELVFMSTASWFPGALTGHFQWKYWG